MQYLFTERAHLMCPHMNFGVVMSVRAPYEEERVRKAMKRLYAAHPFLNALLDYERETNAYYCRVTDRPTAELKLKAREIPDAGDPEVLREYGELTSRDWDLFAEGMLKTVVWPMKEGICFLSTPF